MGKTKSITNGVLANLLYDNLIGLSASIREAIPPKKDSVVLFCIEQCEGVFVGYRDFHLRVRLGFWV